MLPTAAGATNDTNVAASCVKNVRIQRSATGARLVITTAAATYVVTDASRATAAQTGSASVTIDTRLIEPSCPSSSVTATANAKNVTRVLGCMRSSRTGSVGAAGKAATTASRRSCNTSRLPLI